MKSSYQTRWKVLPPVPVEYQDAANTSPIITQLLYNRGVEPHEIAPFLAADSQLQANPFLLPDITQAVSRIYKALLSREKIGIYGDLDVDGVTATAVLVETLSRLGGNVTTYIPNRFSEGHGLKLAGIQKLQSEDVGLIVTVDCGISDISEAKQAQQMGLDLIITDHHVPLATLPQTLAVVDAKRKDSEYPFSELAGVGVAFKLAQALLHNDAREKYLTELLDLVALGTVADMVPLTDENRYLVKEGLKVLNNTQRTGLQEMFKFAGLRPGEIDAEHISFALGPRLNAAGRIDTASTSFRLLTTHSPEEARTLAEELEESNAERKRLANDALSKAKDNLSGRLHLPLLMESDESYPVGVIGLVAGKLVDEFRKPVFVVNVGPELCRGSGRSIPEFDLTNALEKCQDLLVAFGGHKLAAGFAIEPEKLTLLQQRLLELAESQLAHLDLSPELTIDADVALSAFTGDTFRLIQQLQPFGQGNPYPTFLSHKVEVIDHRTFGDHGKWLSLKLKQEDTIWRAVDFESQKGEGGIAPFMDIVFNIGRTRWNGEELLELRLLDFTPSP
ncbi:MAG: single-stranded-DNA-specific exonuclease RecJ [Dehalococcoidia bacterium]|nr:single-stranded-DNA-specific exonuclease RecJ [Dehalococcoidia bacterium]